MDKAVIKGTDERLTQPGKIAIVFSHQDEEKEMLRHVDFLRSEGYLNETSEDLDLEDLPGIQGLRALRVGVDLESKAFISGVQRIAVSQLVR